VSFARTLVASLLSAGINIAFIYYLIPFFGLSLAPVEIYPVLAVINLLCGLVAYLLIPDFRLGKGKK